MLVVGVLNRNVSCRGLFRTLGQPREVQLGGRGRRRTHPCRLPACRGPPGSAAAAAPPTATHAACWSSPPVDSVSPSGSRRGASATLIRSGRKTRSAMSPFRRPTPRHRACRAEPAHCCRSRAAPRSDAASRPWRPLSVRVKDPDKPDHPAGRGPTVAVPQLGPCDGTEGRPAQDPPHHDTAG